MSPLPMQPILKDDEGVIRFRKNAVVEYLLDHGGLDMTKLAYAALEHNWTEEDRAQFAQLIGYSVAGYHELDYVSDESARAASVQVREQFGTVGGCRDGDNPCPVHTRRLGGEED